MGHDFIDQSEGHKYSYFLFPAVYLHISFRPILLDLQMKKWWMHIYRGCINCTLRQFIGLRLDRRRGRVVKGLGHLDHVWSYGVREVVSSIPDRGNIAGWVFHPTRWLVRFPHLNIQHAFPSKFWIYLDHCPRGEAVITGHLRLSSMR